MNKKIIYKFMKQQAKNKNINELLVSLGGYLQNG